MKTDTKKKIPGQTKPEVEGIDTNQKETSVSVRVAVLYVAAFKTLKFPRFPLEAVSLKKKKRGGGVTKSTRFSPLMLSLEKCQSQEGAAQNKRHPTRRLIKQPTKCPKRVRVFAPSVRQHFAPYTGRGAGEKK